MPELRKEPVSGRWVIIATERALRPTDFKAPSHSIKGGGFCRGRKNFQTMPEAEGAFSSIRIFKDGGVKFLMMGGVYGFKSLASL